MTIDYAHPLPADLYDSATQPDVLEYIRDNMTANAKWLEGMDPAGKQTGFKRINSGLLEEWNGTAWVSKALGYVPKTGATDITGSLGMQTTSFGGYQVHITDAPANKKKTMMAGQSDGQSYFGQLNDAGSTWTAGMRIGADGKAYDIASGLPFVTTNPVGAYLPLTGGTLTGQLNISPGAGQDARLAVNAPSSGKDALILFQANNLSRWALSKDTGAESGSNAGSDFVIWRYNDAGIIVSPPVVSIARATGAMNFSTGFLSLNTPGSSGQCLLTLNSASSTDACYIVSSRLGLQRWLIGMGIAGAGGEFTIQNYDDAGTYKGMPFIINRSTSDVTIQGGNTGQTLKVVATGGVGPAIQLFCTGVTTTTLRINPATGALGILNGASTEVLKMEDSGRLSSSYGYGCRNGTSGATSGYTFNIWYDGNVWIVIDNLKLKVTVAALFADEEIAKAEPQKLEPKWFDALQPQVTLSSSELIPEGKLAGLIPGDPEPSLLLGQMILQIQDLKRRISALEAA